MACSSEKQQIRFAVGTYTQKEGHVNGKAEGIYLITLDDSLNIASKDVLAGATNPSYLALHPEGKAIYAVNETLSPQHQSGLVFTYLKNTSETWQAQQMLSSMGAYPCHISYSKDLNTVFVANYGNNIAAYAVKEDGKLDNANAVFKFPQQDSINWRQDSPHAHMTYPVAGTNEVLAVDLGSNRVYHLEYENGFKEKEVYAMDEQAGPRHLVTSKNGLELFILNELNLSIQWMRRDSINGLYQNFIIHNLSDTINDFSKVTAAAIRMHPELNRIYVSTRALDRSDNDKIHVLEWDSSTGQLKTLQSRSSGGQIPRDFNIDPSGKYLFAAHQDSDNIVVYSIDPKNGTLGEAVKEYIIPTPVNIEFY